MTKGRSLPRDCRGGINQDTEKTGLAWDTHKLEIAEGEIYQNILWKERN